ncbi:hypothetical protein EMIHUDRAFT_211850 [Emiliania huxleyi CCMP1516]|uniref:FAD dependent oxidoreductase domain-containing protein n=2 Tax=Emiliania huxleyi TaxID=2903 RepID=A0A0D3IT22_EMIH1|nr:hypothetical protein EMIHUDRAFT_211850 [Emiliania huxleyi CCMP1516]EOD14407.1 hypothetical protein EMIHUDRAFT_211850 [Emiliania huxleyi CCMP1516]|eukprot:XP_005766836.1 hypothetical protein EMIHUDRAFT_211850 [Emiliania huxleyi CCMP1516]
MCSSKVAVCGGGICGVATSYFLAKRGVSTILVDPVGVASAASGRAGGFLALDWNDGSPTGTLARRSFALHEELAQSFGEASVDYRRLTCEAVAVSGGGGLRQRKVAGVQWADLGVMGAPRSMGDESTIAQVHPKKLVDRLWSEAQRLAGSSFRRSVVGVLTEGEGGAVSGVRLSDGQELSAASVLLALGPWSPAWLGLPRASGVKYHSILMRPSRTLSQAGQPLGASDAEVYPRPDGSVYVTGFPDPMAPVCEAPGEVEVRREVTRRLASTMGEVSTELAQAPVELESACHLPFAPDGLPMLGAVPGTPGAFVATGGGCWGILMGPAIGLGVAELMLDGEATSVDIRPFSPARFT